MTLKPGDRVVAFRRPTASSRPSSPRASSSSPKSTSSPRSMSSPKSLTPTSPESANSAGLNGGNAGASSASRVEFTGTVRYVGPAKFFGQLLEVWVGLELDQYTDETWIAEIRKLVASGDAITGERGDGMVGGMRYFACAPRKAAFFRREKVALLEEAGVLAAEKAALKIQCAFRQFSARRAVMASLAAKTWNTLDMHTEELGLIRGKAVARVQLGSAPSAASSFSTGNNNKGFAPPAALPVLEEDFGFDDASQTDDQVAERILRLAEKEVAELTLESLSHIKIAKGYDGPHLRFPLQLDTVKTMMEDFKEGKILHYKYLMALFYTCRQIFAAEPTVQEVTLDDEPETGLPRSIVVVGDTHGQLEDLFTIFSVAGLPAPRCMFLFNGDFVDRGTRGVEILATLCALKILYPDAVFLNRGNHEARAQNAWMGFEEELLAKYTLPEVVEEDDRRAALRVHILCEQMFDMLPLCAVIHERVFVCHGGLFRNDGVTLNHLRNIQRKREPPLNGRSFEDRIFEDLLWSDPRPTPSYPRALQNRRASDRGAGCEFGPLVTDMFCAMNQIALVVRSHECVPEGFEVIHGGRLITIFSASRYCGTQTNKGAFITFKKDLQPQVQQFYAETSTAAFITDDERQRALEEDAVYMIVERICDQKLDLFWYFTRNDVENSGLVSRSEWASALQNVLGLDLPFLHYQRFLTELTASGKVNYSRFLSRFQVRGRDEDNGWQQQILKRVCERLIADNPTIEAAWKKFDPADTGRIGFQAFADELKRLDVGLSETQIYEFMRAVDQDEDGHVAYKEFIQHFGPSMLALMSGKKKPAAPTSNLPASSNVSRMDSPHDEAWKSAVVQNVVNVMFQYRVHLRAAFRKYADPLDKSGKVTLNEFVSAMKALNDSLESPLSSVQIEELGRALVDTKDGKISYRDFFDSLSIQDSHADTFGSNHNLLGSASEEVFATTGAVPVSSGPMLMRKSSSFYVRQLERDERTRARASDLGGLRKQSSLGLSRSSTLNSSAVLLPVTTISSDGLQPTASSNNYSGFSTSRLSRPRKSTSDDEDDEHVEELVD